MNLFPELSVRDYYNNVELSAHIILNNVDTPWAVDSVASLRQNHLPNEIEFQANLLAEKHLQDMDNIITDLRRTIYIMRNP